MKNQPKCTPAIVINQEDLSDYSAYGGSVEALFREIIKEGKAIVVVQQPINAPTTTVSIISSEEDLKRLKEANERIRAWLAKATGEET
jgi:hypothetical protein